MRKFLVVIGITVLGLFTPTQAANAQFPIMQIIQAGIKKVIKAVDLAIQRLQNETIWLQNAQKTIENTLSKLKLDDISGWVEKQRTLYKEYFDELKKVKTVIAYYHRVRNIADKQVRLVQEYRRAWTLFQQDDNFSTDEITYMGKVYTGILDESLKNLEQVFLVINSFETSMSDSKRLELINSAADEVDANYADMKKFNRQNMILSIQRSKEQHEVDVMRKLYGIDD